MGKHGAEEVPSVEGEGMTPVEYSYREGNYIVAVFRCKYSHCSWAYECVTDDFGNLVKVRSLSEW